MPRLFFALLPDPAQQAAIAAAMQPMLHAMHARPVPDVNLHLTLTFLGEVAAARLPRLIDAASGIAPGKLQLALTRADCWEGSQVLCLLPEESPALQATRRLAEHLVDAARAAGITPDEKYFRGHVTAGRKVPPAASRTRRWPELLPMPLPFTADGFALMESSRGPDGSRYTVINTWPAAPGRQGS